MPMDADYALLKKVEQLVRPKKRQRLWTSKHIATENDEHCNRNCEYTAKYSFC